MIGLTFNDRYCLESEIGQGGMGAVYRARDILLDRNVAVKVTTAGKLGIECKARLLQEAQVVASLIHPNIVAIYDVGTPRLKYRLKRFPILSWNMWRVSRLPIITLRRQRLQRQVALVLEDARRVADEETRMAMYRQAEMITFEETAVVPLEYG